MNLQLFLRVLARFRLLVLGGIVAAIALATVSAVRLELDGVVPRFEYRSSEKWQSASTLLVTQRGFPWGRSVLDEVLPVGPDGKGGFVPVYSEGTRFAGLAVLYAQLAKGDAVREIVRRGGPIDGEYDAAPVRSEDGSATLPLIEIGAFAASPSQAQRLAQRATDAFLTYLRRTQDANRIPPARRVEVQIVARPDKAVLAEGRRMTGPIFVFVLVASATLMLAFALENLRPRSAAVAVGASPGAGPTAVARPKRKTPVARPKRKTA